MKIRHILLFLLLVGSFFGTRITAQSLNESKSQVIILDIPRFDLAEITPEYRFLNQFINRSSTGLVAMPINSLRIKPAQIYLYFNAGNFLQIPDEGYGIYDVDEIVGGIRVGDLYETYMGDKALSQNAVNLDLAKIRRLNQAVSFAKLGMVGETLHQAGLKTAAIGSSDTKKKAARYGAALVMDRAGRVDYGALESKMLRNDSHFPSGVRTNAEQIIKSYNNFQGSAAVIVITLGDLERIESCQAQLTPAQKDYFRRLTLQRYDRLLARLLSQEAPDKMVMIFTCLQPQKLHLKDNGLTPVLIKSNHFQGGILYSPYTRKNGHVTYNNLQSTIFNHLKITPWAAQEAPISQIKGHWQQIAIEQLGLVTNYSFRMPLLTTYVVLLLLLTISIILGLLIKIKTDFLKLLGWGYLFLLTMPATCLLEAIINPTKWSAVIFYTLGIAAVILACSTWLGRKRLLKTLAWLSLITVGLILLDGLFNGYFEIKSFFGYTAVSGKRYYGIGNEYMGVLMGAYIIFVSLSLEKMGKWRTQILTSAVALISLIFFHPYCGADVGGGITAILGLGLTSYLWLERPIRLRELVGLIMILILALIGIGIFDLLLNPNSISHFGQLLQSIGTKGLDSLLIVVYRKLEMSWWVMNYTPLTMVLLGILLLILVIYKYPSKRVQRFILQYPTISHGCLGLSLTALIGFFFNDSGIVSAAMIFMFGVAMVLVRLIEDADV